MRYKIQMTPLEFIDSYGSSIDITKYATINGVPSITAEIDQGDFDVGIFNFDSVNLTLDNSLGWFNDPDLDARSIIPFRRDSAIIEIIYIDNDEVEYQSFKGIIADRATTQDLDNHTISFYILSLDSIFEKVVVRQGVLKTNETVSQCLVRLFTNPIIDRLLNADLADINPTIDHIVDDVTKFDNLTVKKTVDNLLQSSNGILLIDSSANISVRSRAANTNTPHGLYLNDQFRRDNILSFNNLNNGLQRMFNYVVVNDTVSINQTSINLNDERVLNLTFDFITNTTTDKLSADSILSDFDNPRQELTVVTHKDTAKNINNLDLVTLNVLPSLNPAPNNHTHAIYDVDSFETSYFSAETSELIIDSRKKYKVIGTQENPADFVVHIKLRFTGDYTT